MNDNNTLSVKQTMDQVEAGRSRSRIRRWIVVVIVLLGAAGGALAVSLRPSADTMGYGTHAIMPGDLQTTITATGNLEATNQVEIGSELSGIVTKVTVDYNDAVQPGQPLAYLDGTKYEAAVLKSRAEVVSAKAQYQEARAARSAAGKTLERLQKTRELTGGKLPSMEELEQAEANLEGSAAAEDAAAAAVDIAKAALTLDETDLEKTVIYSPISGVVLSRDIDEGQTVAASLQAPVLFTLAEDLRNMELQIDVDEADVGRIRQGQSAQFAVDAYPEKSFAAEITQIRYGAETTDGVVTYKTVLKVSNPDLLLRPGMTATADIVVRHVDNALLVPNSALLYSPTEKKAEEEKRSLLSSLMPGPGHRPTNSAGAMSGNPQASGTARVWMVGGQRQPVPVDVEKIATNGVMTAVRSAGLQRGDKVITNEIVTEK